MRLRGRESREFKNLNSAAILKKRFFVDGAEDVQEFPVLKCADETECFRVRLVAGLEGKVTVGDIIKVPEY